MIEQMRDALEKEVVDPIVVELQKPAFDEGFTDGFLAGKKGIK